MLMSQNSNKTAPETANETPNEEIEMGKTSHNFLKFIQLKLETHSTKQNAGRRIR